MPTSRITISGRACRKICRPAGTPPPPPQQQQQQEQQRKKHQQKEAAAEAYS
jgi:hypothetical protein